jgi:hypothetical protein
MTSSTPEGQTPSDPLFGRPLWYLEFGDGDICVAGDEEQQYLVLFTSTERASAFAAGNGLEEQGPATTILFSETEEQFQESVEQAAEGGFCGAVIDPDEDEDLVTVIEFSPSGEEP